jgi:hypothetical protein
LAAGVSYNDPYTALLNKRMIKLNCPLCNKDNQCGLEAGQTIEACWCSKAVFPKGILELVPEEQQEKSCICKSCLERRFMLS